MLGIGTASLVGLPAMSGYAPPRGALVGLLSDPDGAGVPDAPVALFDDATLALVEITHTDEHGRFALQQAPERFHLCARPDPTKGLLPAWALDLQRGPLFAIDLVAQEGVPIVVRVRDGEGAPVAGADVRCYGLGRRATQVVARARTGADGRARLLAPERAHVGAFGPDPELLPAWRFHAALAEDETIDLELPRGRRLHGRAVDEDGNGLGDVVVSAWDRRDGWQWDGYRLSEQDGAFALFAAAAASELRAYDRTQEHLPTRAEPGPTPSLELVLARTERVPVRCEDDQGSALPARVWAWSEEAGTWGWGSLTDGAGRIEVAAGGALRAVAQPLARGSSDPTLWESASEGDGIVLVRSADR